MEHHFVTFVYYGPTFQKPEERRGFPCRRGHQSSSPALANENARSHLHSAGITTDLTGPDKPPSAPATRTPNGRPEKRGINSTLHPQPTQTTSPPIQVSAEKQAFFQPRPRLVPCRIGAARILWHCSGTVAQCRISFVFDNNCPIVD